MSDRKFHAVSMTLLSVACGLALPSAATAQSSNTWYGVFDVALREQTHATQQSLTAGLIQGTRLGFRGDHRLPNGLTAIYNLEAGLSPVNGQSGQQGQLFGRQAWVGVAGDFGTLTAGRQFGVGFDLIGQDDPYGIANASPIAWQFNLFGARFDNTLKYAGKRGDLRYEAAVSFGNKAGDVNGGRTVGAGVGYQFGRLNANFGLQQSTDTAGKRNESVFGGAKFELSDSTTLYGAFVSTKRDQGFTPCANANQPTSTNCPNGPLANTNLATGFTQGDARTRYFQFGAKQRFDAHWEGVVGVMQDRTHIQTIDASTSHRTFYAVLDYYIDKDSDVYAGLDFNKVGANSYGNAAYALYAGHQSQTGVSLGLRYRF